MDASGYIKAFIDLRRETGGRVTREHLWLRKTFGGYRVESIPFDTQVVAYQDIVKLDEEAREIIWVEQPSEYRNGLLEYLDLERQRWPLVETSSIVG